MSGRVTLHGVHVGFGARQVLCGVDLAVGPGDRIGVVAPNGVGKSTLLRVVAGELVPEAGTVLRAPPGTSVLRLSQEPDVRPGESLREHLARRTGVTGAQHELDAASQGLAAGRPGAEDRYAAALDRWLALGAADLAERADAAAAYLRLPVNLPERGARALSGGQRARLALAAVLLARPDVLLLDEPTNDLDDDGLARLEQHVRSTPAGVLLVSHDRAFLAATVDRVVELDEFTGRAVEYRGGWDAYLQERAAARNRAVHAREAYEQERGRLLDRARQQREWARRGAQRAANPRYQPDPDRALRSMRIEGAQRLGAAATRTARAVERLDADAPEVVRQPWQLRLCIAAGQRAGDVVVSLEDAVLVRGDVRLGPFTFTLGWAERVRLTGPNGAGKSTVLDAILGRSALAAGRRYAGPSVVFGELDQSRRLFDSGESATDLVRAHAQLPDAATTRTLLAKFRLAGDLALQPARTLSPGERTRAALALLAARGVNCLVLDEPTNHLDIEAIEQLETALAGFGGALLLVTHDRRLAEAVAVDRSIDVRTWWSRTDGQPATG